MAIKGFDYKEFADNLAAQAKELVPPEFNDEEKAYIVNILHEYTHIAGEALYNGQGDIELNAEQASTITQIIAEWTFNNSVELISSQVPQEFWDTVLQKIAFIAFEIAKEAYKKGMPQENMLELIEHHVEKSCNETLNELRKKALETNEYSDNDEFDYNGFELEDETENFKISNIASTFHATFI